MELNQPSVIQQVAHLTAVHQIHLQQIVNDICYDLEKA